MKFTTSVLFILASQALSMTNAQRCLSSEDQFKITDDGCDQSSFEDALDSYLATTNCSHGAQTELRHIFGSAAAAERAVASTCAAGWAKVDSSKFSDVDARFTNSFMNEYVTGGTFLNSKFERIEFQFSHLLLPNLDDELIKVVFCFFTPLIVFSIFLRTS